MRGDRLFGYVKPVKGELLVRELELYRAFYCGLCRTMKRTVSPLFTPSLSYDFVFMALVRSALTGETHQMEKIRCSLHPLKKRLSVKPNRVMIYTSDAALALHYYKINDDLRDRDSSFFKRLALRPYARLLRGFLKKRRKSNPDLPQMEGIIRERLAALDHLERQKTANADLPAGEFGALLGDLFCCGLQGSEQKIAHTVGINLGRYIYYIDACDDVDKDHQNKAYNPLLEYYQTPQRVREHFDLIDTVLSLYIRNIASALSLADTTAYSGMIDNIVRLGLGQEAYRIFVNKHKIGGKHDRSL